MVIPGGSAVKTLPAMKEMQKKMEEGMETHSSIFAWRIPWTEEPGEMQFIGSQRVGHDWATELNWTEGSFKSGIEIQLL